MKKTPGNSTERRSLNFTRRRFLQRGGTGLAAVAAMASLGGATPSLNQADSPGRPTRGRNSNDRVLIIGAGMAGLTAARYLRDYLGFNQPGQILLLEGRDRVGGRMWVDHSLGTPVDMGATWIHGQNGNPLTRLADHFGLTRTPSNFDSIDMFDRNGALISNSVANRAYYKFLAAMARATASKAGLNKDRSMAASLDAVGAPNMFRADEQDVAEYYFSGVVEEYSTYLQRLGTKAFQTDGAYGGQDMLLHNGFGELPERMAIGLHILFNEAVQQVNYRSGLVQVTTQNGVYEAEHCIVTLPLGVLKSGAVQFTPGLPNAMQDAIGAMGFGTRHRLVMEFPHAFWDVNREFLGKTGRIHQRYGGGEHILFVNRAGLNGKPILSAETVEQFGRQMESKTPADAARRVMQDLRAMYGSGIPDPIEVRSNSWASDPFSLGAYSSWVVGSGKRHCQAFQQPIAGCVYLAGEHTHERYPSTVHGALLSGIRAAKQAAG